MNGYEKIMYQMRKQGQKGAEPGVRLGEIGKDMSCRVGALTLQRDDLLFNEMLLSGYLDQEGAPVVPLQEGDKVLVKRLSAQKYAVIARLTEGSEADA